MQDYIIDGSLWFSPLGSELIFTTIKVGSIICYGWVLKLLIICAPFEAPLQFFIELYTDLIWF